MYTHTHSSYSRQSEHNHRTILGSGWSESACKPRLKEVTWIEAISSEEVTNDERNRNEMRQ